MMNRMHKFGANRKRQFLQTTLHLRFLDQKFCPRCPDTFRAKNGLGGMGEETLTFTIASDGWTVLSASLE